MSRLLHTLRCVFISTGLSIVTVFLFSAVTFAVPVEKNTNPCNLSQGEVQGFSHDASTEAEALNAYIAAISSMVHAERFDALDCIADRARANKERFPGGHWKIHELYKGLDNPAPTKHATGEEWQDLIGLLQRWIETNPKSVTARVALASAWVATPSQRGVTVTPTRSAKTDGSCMRSELRKGKGFLPMRQPFR